MVYDNSDPSSPVELGVMSYNSRRDMYSATFVLASSPSEILVASSEGGEDTYIP